MNSTTLSENKWINGVVGHATHSPLLVPFYPWAYSHKQHHRFHNHEEKDMSHPWMSAERYKDTNAIVRCAAGGSVSGFWFFPPTQPARVSFFGFRPRVPINR